MAIGNRELMHECFQERAKMASRKEKIWERRTAGTKLKMFWWPIYSSGLPTPWGRYSVKQQMDYLTETWLGISGSMYVVYIENVYVKSITARYG